MHDSRGLRLSFAIGIGVSIVVVILGLAAGRCGDGICESPETAERCPEDCADLLPNPLRAIVSEDILTWRNWLDGGGFEEGDGIVELLPHSDSSLAPAGVERRSDAARSGLFGMRIQAEAYQGIVLAVRAKIEKGERTRYSFWVRAHAGTTSLRVSVLGVEATGRPPRELYRHETPIAAGRDWMQVQFVFASTRGVDHALLCVEVGPDMLLDIDDVAVDAEQWAEPQICRFERSVGGIRVPWKPVAPFHFSVLIHIEDPAAITQQEGYFREKSAVFIELAKLLHQHGGFLTIQPEEDWPLAATRFAPELLADLVERYGVVYSTHTHGPACIDAQGRLRSHRDCQSCASCAGWTPIPTDTDPYTPTYVGALRELISEISGTQVRDHNGNFHYVNASALADVGIETWSAFKDHNTQATFDQLFTNPWRPTACDAIASPDLFQTHDPSSRIVFVPGWGQAITRHPERLHARLAGMLSRLLCYADAGRVNTFYIVTHVDHYRSEGGELYVEFDEATGQITLHDAFLRDLGYWEETLSKLIDPLVAEGYLTWTSLPEMGQLYAEWEQSQ
jgi:hypothetical protein